MHYHHHWQWAGAKGALSHSDEVIHDETGHDAEPDAQRARAYVEAMRPNFMANKSAGAQTGISACPAPLHRDNHEVVRCRRSVWCADGPFPEAVEVVLAPDN